MKDHAKNCEAAGAAQAKSGDNRQALSRPSGYGATCSAMENKTRSRHQGSSTNNKWHGTSCGFGSNENVKGYGG